ncbi:SRPBCC domain-containing protein [Nitrospira sp. Nam80]
MAKWLPRTGLPGKCIRWDAKVGGAYQMSFTNFTTGKTHSFGGKYLDLVPHECNRYTDIVDMTLQSMTKVHLRHLAKYC